MRPSKLIVPVSLVQNAGRSGLLHDFCRIDLPPAPICAGLDGVVIAQA
jgi:hypothetical protein